MPFSGGTNARNVGLVTLRRVTLVAGLVPLAVGRWAMFTSQVKKLVEYGRDDHPADDPERAQLAWAVAVLDDCDRCGDLRVELTMEEVGRPGSGLVAHLAPQTARRLHAALSAALREIGQG